MNIRSILSIATCLLVLAIPAVGLAQINVDINAAVRERMRVPVQERLENLKPLRDIATGTKPEIKDMRGEGRIENKPLLRNASSSIDRKEVRTNVRLDIFKAQKTRLITQLELALNNLKQIRARIFSRIEKAESSGRTMTEARQKIAIADAKIVVAVQEIAKLAGFTPNATSTATTTATSTSPELSPIIELGKARQLGEAAIKAIKDVRRALVDVTISIAHNMGVRCQVDGDGIKCNANATTTPDVNTGTSTATTTP
jgi:hypothetical protein